MAASLARVGRDATFAVADAETVTFPDEAFDVVWSVECTEHLFDKPAFFARAARWLASGGRMAIVSTWSSLCLPAAKRMSRHPVPSEAVPRRR